MNHIDLFHMELISLFSSMLSIEWTCVCVSVSLQGEHQRRLYKDLMRNYNPLERPVYNDSHSLTVNFSFSLMQIMDVVSPHTPVTVFAASLKTFFLFKTQKVHFAINFILFCIIKVREDWGCKIWKATDGIPTVVFYFQDEKNQVLTTNIWLQLVRFTSVSHPGGHSGILKIKFHYSNLHH